MGSRAFYFLTTYYLSCILCRDAFAGSTLAKVLTSTNNASQSGEISKTESMRIKQSIETRTRLDGITLKDNQVEFETPQESSPVKNLLLKANILSDFRKIKCSKYCIQQLGTDKDNPFEDINLIWSLARSESKADNILLECDLKSKILRCASVNNKTILDNNCQIYLNLDCEIVNMEIDSNIQYDNFDSNSEFNHQSTEAPRNSFQISISESPKKLAHRTNLSGYTETKFHVDANVSKIIIKILGNLTRTVLVIPINRKMRRPEITMWLARTYDAKGVSVGARNPPPGGWRMKLTGAENSKYSFDVIAYFGANEENDSSGVITDANSTSETDDLTVHVKDFHQITEKENDTQNETKILIINNNKQFDKLEEKTRETVIDSALPMNLVINNKPKLVFERSIKIEDIKNNTDGIIIDNTLPDASLFSLESTMENTVNNNLSLINNSLMSYSNFKTSQNASDIKIFNERISVPEKIQTRSSEIASLNEDIDTNVKPFNRKTNENEISMKMTDSSKNQELSAKLSDNVQKDIFERKKVLIEVNANTDLIARQGTLHRVVFDVTNNCILAVRYAIRARSSPFRIYSIQPLYTWLYPGQTNYVVVYIIIPAATNQDTVNTLTLFVDGTEISEKTVYIYVQDAFSKIIDYTKPTIEYSFNNNCAGKLNKDRCGKTFWTADITIQDTDSGLKSVLSTPNKIYPRTEFISGTKEPVTFYYLSTCCSTTAKITATDVLNNQYSRTIDVAEWDNLSEGEIAAITVGALFLLLLLILLIIAIVYCFRKRNSHDLPYTQRYGSRPPARSERTSF